MKFRNIVFLFLCVYGAAFSLEVRDIGVIEKSSLQYQSGDWVKVVGVVDTMYDSSTYILSDSTGSIQFELCEYGLFPGDSVEVIGVLDPAVRKSSTIMEIETKILYHKNELLWESDPERSLPDKYESSPENRAMYSVKRQQIITGSIMSSLAVASAIPTLYWLIPPDEDEDESDQSTTAADSLSVSYFGTIDFDMPNIMGPFIAVGISGITFFTVMAITQFMKAAKVPEMELKGSKIEISILPQVSNECVGIAVTAAF